MSNLTAREDAIRANLIRFGSASLFGNYEGARSWWNALVTEVGDAVVPYLKELRNRQDFDAQTSYIDSVIMEDLGRWAAPLF